jgi:hypothetical protein
METALHFLGLPGAARLGLLTGVANFIPYLGSLIAALAVALVAMPLGYSTLIWVMVIYFSIQTIEGYISAPLIQRGAVNIPPAWTLFALWFSAQCLASWVWRSPCRCSPSATSQCSGSMSRTCFRIGNSINLDCCPGDEAGR